MKTAGEETVLARGPEVAVALLLAVLGVLVVADSLRVGIGWADDGPRAGYFPFYIGCGLIGAAAWIGVGQLLRWRKEAGEFASRAQLVQVVSVLVPMVVHVGLIFGLGIYLASLLLIAYFMLRHGRYGLLPTAAVAVGVPLLFFMVFERWFLVPLPKGPIERLLGL